MRRIYGAAALLLVLLGPGCGETPQGVDIVEIRTYASPIAIRDAAVGNAVATELLAVIGQLGPTSPVKDAEVHSGASPFIRVSLLSDEKAGRRSVLCSLLLFGPDEERPDGASVIFFRSRSEEDWQRTTLPAATVRATLERVEKAAGVSLTPILSMTPGELDAVRRSIAQVSSMLGSFGESIRLAGAEAVDWPDAALGYPRPGQVYAQVISPGYRVRLELPDGRAVECHTSADRVEVAPEFTAAARP